MNLLKSVLNTSDELCGVDMCTHLCTSVLSQWLLVFGIKNQSEMNGIL